MLSAIYYGAMYGGTITSVLMNVPGEGASAVTCHRRLPDGEARARRRGARDRRDRLLHRRHGRDHRARRRRAAARRGRAEVRAAGILRADGARARSCSSASRASVAAAGLISALLGLALSIPGTDIVEGTPRLTFGSLDLLDGDQLRAGHHGALRHRRDPGEPRAASTVAVETPRSAATMLTRRGYEGLGDADRARHRASASSSGSSPASARSCRRSPPTRSRRSSRGIRSGSARARSRASPARRRRTTPTPTAR